MKSFVTVLAFTSFCVLFQDSSAQVPLPSGGKCDDTCKRNNSDIDLNSFIGIWFLQQFSTGLLQAGAKCGYLNATAVVGNTLIANFHFQTDT
jgi:hypothetical protein